MLDKTTDVTLSWYEHGALVQRQADKRSRVLRNTVDIAHIIFLQHS